MASVCDLDPPEKKSMIEQAISTYELPYRFLEEYLRNKFGKDAFHVQISLDQYVMTLPRRLTEQERIEMEQLRKTRGRVRRLFQKEARSFAQRSQNTRNTERAPSADILPIRPIGSRKEDSEPIIPFYEASSLLISPIPSKEDDLNEIRSISNVQTSSQGSTSSLYSVLISYGFTCSVYAVDVVDARWSWVRAGSSPDKGSQGRKVAVKRLAQGTTPEEFIQEYQALKAATRSHHRNIVDFLEAFRYEDENKLVYYNFSFPLAVCSLKELFYTKERGSRPISGSADQQPAQSQITGDFYDLARQNLWSEFEGLANGLAYLHELCQIVHSDIKPSNILLYESSGVERIVVAKLTDFGMAADLQTKLSWRLGSKEARSAWQYDAPEIRNHVNDTTVLGPSPAELKGGDVWKLGSVFVEMLAFLIKGRGGVTQFRKFITTTYRELTSDGISDTRFDDGKQVKAEVLVWISRLASLDPRVRELEAILQSMLSLTINRPTAKSVSDALKKSSLCLHFDGMRYLTFTPSLLVRPPPLVDRCREHVEKRIGHRVDWRPFGNPDRTCSPGYTRISWLLNRENLYIDVPDSVAQSYRDTCRPLSCFSQPLSHPSGPPGSSPTYHSSSGTYSQSGIDLGTLGKEPTLTLVPSGSHDEESTLNESVGTSVNSSNLRTRAIWKEIYWCVDQAWSEPRITRLCSLRERPRIFDDLSLCQHLTQEYSRVRTWKGRYLSWKSCLAVEFIRFSRANREDHVVKIQNGLPPLNSRSYEYVLKQPEEVHMMMAAEQLVYSLHNPNKRVAGDDRTLKMIPKRLIFTPPTAKHASQISIPHPPNDDEDDDHWGIYARARFSLWKILAWITVLTTLGLVFVIFWLAFVDKKDLQNAFVPYTVVAMGVMMGLGIPQFLEVD